MFLPETMPQHDPARHAPPPAPLFHRATIGPGLALFCGVAALAGFLSVAALYGRDIGLDGARFVLLLFGVVVVATRVLFSTLPDRVPALRLVTAALASTGLGLLLMAMTGSPLGLFAGAAITAVGVAFLTPAVFAFVFGRIDPTERGSATGTASFFIDLGLGAGPILIGLTAALAGFPAGLGLMAVIAAGGAVATGYVMVQGRAGAAPSTSASP